MWQITPIHVATQHCIRKGMLDRGDPSDAVTRMDIPFICWLLHNVVLLPAILTQFANNMIVTSVFVTIICFIGKALPFNPVILSCLVILSANLSMFFPAANPMNAILFAQRDLVTFRQEASFGFLSCMLLCLFLAVAGYGWGCLVF